MSDPVWFEAVTAATLLAVDPVGLGGVALRARPGPVRDAWLATLRRLLPDAPMPRMPVSIRDDRLLGGLDLGATLATGRPVASRGLLAEADGGVVLAAMAERLPATTAARLVSAMDRGEVLVEREGVVLRAPTRFAVVAFDEGIDDEQPPAALTDRLAFRCELDTIAVRDVAAPDTTEEMVRRAQAQHPGVSVPETLQAALCETALALGVASLRAVVLAQRATRAAAALAGRDIATDEDARLAARLVLAPRATTLPPPDTAPEVSEREEPEPEASGDQGGDDGEQAGDSAAETVLAAAAAAIPPGLLERIRSGAVRTKAAGRSGAARQAGRLGRPAGSRAGVPGGGARLDVLATLQAAAPWQRLRPHDRGGLAIRPDDFRIVRRVQKPRTTTIFVVDASGSAALQRLAEAKGAVELLLGECYVRRDQVAVIAFRGRGAELLLPPSGSLTRAKRSLAGLPGGGGTPLAAGLDVAASLADAVLRRAGRPVVVVLTDGRANVARDGRGDRVAAMSEAVEAAGRLRAGGVAGLLIDTSPRPNATAQSLAAAMDAAYLPLPQADSAAMFRAALAR